MARKRKIEKLSGTIEKLLAARGWAAKLKEYRVLGRWEEAVGGVIAQHAQPSSIRGRKLTVVVDSSVWMQQLSLLRPQVIEQVNRALGEEAVEEITLRLGEVACPDRRPDGRTEPLPEPAPEDRAKAEAFAAGVADPAVREALRHLIEKDLRARRRKRA